MLLLLSFSLCEMARAPSRTSAEACLTDWPSAHPQWWDKCSVLRHHQACLTVHVKRRCCATSLFSRNGLRQPACLQPGQSPPEREAKEVTEGGNWRGLVPRRLPARLYNHCFSDG